VAPEVTVPNPPRWTPPRTARRTIRSAPWIALLVAAAACQSGTPPPGGAAVRLSIGSPVEGQALSGTVAVLAAGVGGKAQDLTFRLGSLSANADSDGIAVLNTRSLTDGAYVLEASATVAGVVVSDAVDVTVLNDLPSSAAVGAAGGALRSGAGSLAIVPPGALTGSVNVAVSDTTQAEILDAFGVDYTALGVTFLGALTIDADTDRFERPVAVDLAGWAAGVQPGQQVVMFSVAPDADGDGIGELMFAANAMATDDGSVITRPTPRSEVYGFGGATGSVLRQSTSARPGEIVSVTGRGFNPAAVLSNVARFGGATDVLALVTTVEDVLFNPLMQAEFALPALPSGSANARLHNLTTGYASDSLALSVGSLGSGSASAYQGLLEQVDAAVARVTADRPDLAQRAAGWSAALAASSSSTAAAMAANSGLVSAANLSLLQSGPAGTLSAEQRQLARRHALWLDAVAASVPELAASAADLATLLMVAAPASGAGVAGWGARPATNHSGSSCSGSGPSADISIGSPTGMGSAPSGSCLGGSASGGGASGSAVTAGAAPRQAGSLRGGTFTPTPGAVVSVLRASGTERLAPFTAVTDANGGFYVPFVPPGEPFNLTAFDPATFAITSVSGVAGGPNQLTPVDLVFGVPHDGPGPIASFTITPLSDPRFEGTVYYRFDASASLPTEAGGEVLEYIWDFDGFVASMDDAPVVERGFGRQGSYTIRLAVMDDLGLFGVSEQILVIDDLPYDYWGLPPQRADTLSDGSGHGTEASGFGYALSGDGRYVAFAIGEWGDGDLVPEDTNGLRDVYRKDMLTGELRLVSEGAADIEAGWLGVTLSGDGRYLAFASYHVDDHRLRLHRRDMVTDELVTFDLPEGDVETTAAGLSADGTVLAYNVTYSPIDGTLYGGYVHDFGEDVTVQLEHPDTPNFRFDAIAVSADGTHVAVRHYSGGAIYVVELETDEWVRADVNADGEPANAAVTADGQMISADGRFVVFHSAATNLVPEAGPALTDQVYLKDLETGAVERVSLSALGAVGDGPSRSPMISADARYVLFDSFAENLTPLVEVPDSELGWCYLDMCGLQLGYVKDRATGHVAVATMGMHHVFPAGGYNLPHQRFAAGGSHLAFFHYAGNLVPTGEDDSGGIYRAVNPIEEP
jgi:hypothetical protein